MMDMRSAALAYCTPNGERSAWAVFPCSYNKTPIISREKGGHGCLDATTDKDQINKWWTEYPRANIGVATGTGNGFIVLDVDRGHDESVDGTETLRELEHKIGKLPDTVEALTPNGGRHLYFKYPEGVQIGCVKHNRSDSPFPGLDVRGNGGYVLAPPSAIKTAAGWKSYEWEVASFPHEHQLAELPQPWIDWIVSVAGGQTITQGTRNDSLFRYACSLRAQSYPEDRLRAMVVEQNRTLCNPPLEAKEVQTIIAQALKYSPGTSLQTMMAAVVTTKKQRQTLTLDVVCDEMALRGYGIKYNLITKQYETDGRTAAGRVMSIDDLAVMMHDALADSYRGCSFDALNQYLTFAGRESSYNPVLELLERSTWDGVDRLPQLYDLIGIADDDSLSRVLVKKWLMQSVALLFNRDDAPFGADGCLVFNGVQGAGKTSLLRHLAINPAWFGEGSVISDDKDTTRRVLSTWIAELGELETTLKSDVAALKAFVTNSIDHYRLPYAKSDTVSVRMTSLCGTCNSDRYLIDVTGNRRWWSVPFTQALSAADIAELDALQLWSQIFSEVAPLSYDAKTTCFRLTEAERVALSARNGLYEKPQKGELEVRDILDKAEREKLPYSQITVAEFKEYWPILRAYSVQQIGVALTRCGIESTRDGNRIKRTRLLPTPRV